MALRSADVGKCGRDEARHPICGVADTAVGPPICDLSIDELLEDFRSQTLGKETAKLPKMSIDFVVVLNFIYKTTTQEITY